MALRIAESARGALRCPVTGETLTLLSRRELEREAGSALHAVRRRGVEAPAVGPTPHVLATASGRHAYPVVDGLPVLLAPERLVPGGSPESVDLRDPRYREAYEERAFYDAVAARNAAALDDRAVRDLMGRAILDAAGGERFPEPVGRWIDSRHEAVAQLEAYRHLRLEPGARLLQLGGGGSHAVKALLAGCREALLVSPMLGEARFAMALAARFGVAARLSCVVAVGEELPLAGRCVDAIYSGGCLHHMRLARVLPEVRRVLAPGGRFAAVDPYRAPLHALGTRILGKRERGVFCRPIDAARLDVLRRVFPQAVVRRHGPVLRYPLVALHKLGVALPATWMLRIGRWDDRLGALLGLPETWGSSVFLGALAEK